MNTREEKNSFDKTIDKTIVKDRKKISKNINKNFRKTRTNVQQEKTNEKFKEKNNESRLKVIALGGLDEIGKNLTVFEYEDEIIIVDCGIGFPEEEMLGIDIVIPDFTYLEKNHNKIKGLLITHGHEDHIGAVPYLLKKINIPVYAPKFAVGLIEGKLQEHKVKNGKVIEIKEGNRLKLGKFFDIEFIHSAHSIRDSLMLAITTPVGTVVHTGDFKVEFSPVNGQTMNIGKMAEIGNKGVLLLLSDSTNSEVPGFTVSEKSIGKVFADIFEGETKRILVATFSSHIDRVQQIVNVAVENKRKVSISGKSMINMISTARKLGYLDVPDDTFIDLDNIDKYPDEELVVITTGSQGETMSALSRMALGQHKKLKVGANDLVVISADPIPGNEANVSNIINLLMKSGAEVVYSSEEKLHVSGHACQEEQKLILSLFRPKFFMPVHGEYRQLMAHKETALLLGVPRENIIIGENGQILEFSKTEFRKGQIVQHGKVFVDGLGVGDVGNVVLRDRQHLSQDGLIIVVVTMDSTTGELVAGPDIVSRGFVYIKESEELLDQLRKNVLETINEIDSRDWTTLKGSIRSSVLKFVYKKTERNPMVLPIIVEV